MNNQDRAGGEREAKQPKPIIEMIEEQVQKDSQRINALNAFNNTELCTASQRAYAWHVWKRAWDTSLRVNQSPTADQTALTTLQGEVDKLRNALEELVEWSPELINEWRWKAGTIPRNQRDYDAITAALDKAEQALNPTPHE